MISQLTLFSAVAWAIDAEPAAGGAGGAQSSLMSFLPLILIFVVMYFLMIRPQQKRQKEHQTMLSAIQKGDEVQTNGGILGKVTGIDTEKNILIVEIAPQVRVKVGRGFVARVLTGKAAETAPAAEKDKDKEKDKAEKKS